VRPGEGDCCSQPPPDDPTAAVAAVLAEGGDVVGEWSVRDAGLAVVWSMQGSHHRHRDDPGWLVCWFASGPDSVFMGGPKP
jgi:hypothetical protein